MGRSRSPSDGDAAGAGCCTPGVALPPETLPENDPTRIDRYNDAVRAIAAADPAVKVVDLAGWTAALPGGELDATARPNGATFGLGAAADAGGRLARCQSQARAGRARDVQAQRAARRDGAVGDFDGGQAGRRT